MARNIQTTRRARTRITRPRTNDAKQVASERLNDLASEIKDIESQMAVLSASLQEKYKESENLLAAEGVSEHPVPGVGTHKMVVPRSNAKTEISIRGFRDLVSEDEFLDAVSVTKANAQQVLSNKQLESISTVTPGAKKDPVYKFDSE